MPHYPRVCVGDITKRYANINVDIPEEGEIDLCKAIQDMINESNAECGAEGRAKGIAEFMLKKGYPMDEIIVETNMSEESIRALKAAIAQ